ncbi:MAG: potassium channel protein, partial [Candidatus Krumholzibacteria bacterium]|nr:potassium channel protein [Candidatus Krumholzibacteria bacterium]
MKTFPAQIASVVRSRRGRRNLRVLGIFFLVLAGLILVYSVGFHLLMLREGQEHTWITGFYWTLTVMSTLGFGDITFHTDLGRVFSILVLASGMIFFLVLLPFTFIEFFYEPWMNAQAMLRAPRKLSPETRGHVLFTGYDAVASALIRRFEQYQQPYAVVVPDVDDALRLYDLGLNVIVGGLDDPETWSKGRVQTAAMVVSTDNDVTNTNVAFTVRGLTNNVPVVTSASDEASVDIQELSGSNHVMRLEEMMGQAFARRALGGDAVTHVVGRFDKILIAEANARRTPLVGKKLRDSKLREKTGVTVVGVWERGRFEAARAETEIRENTVLMLAASKQQLAQYDDLFRIYNVSTAPVVIIGGGRVGRATSRALARREMDYRIVERVEERIHDTKRYVQGNAADLAVLEKAGIRETSTVIITTHEDDLNVYLTIYCRQLRPDIQILSRSTSERNVVLLYRAGADNVLSYATMGASDVMSLLRRGKVLMVEEGLDVFKMRVPAELAERTIAECSIRERTGCSVVAIGTNNGMEVGPDPTRNLPAGADIVLIGSPDAEERF